MVSIDNQIAVIKKQFDVVNNFIATSQICHLKFKISDLLLQIADLKNDCRKLRRHFKNRWELPYNSERQCGV
ncbi:unnamed protein product [Calypogeia fissa]